MRHKSDFRYRCGIRTACIRPLKPPRGPPGSKASIDPRRSIQRIRLLTKAERVESAIFLVAHASRFSGQVAKVEQPSMPNDTAGDHFNLIDAWRMQHKNTLHSDVEADLSDGKRAANPGSVPLDDDALEHLNTQLVAFDNLIVYANRVPDAEFRQVRS